MPPDSFFMHYENGKCDRNPVGENKLRKVPKVVAHHLNLEQEEYTGHCFRRSAAATAAANARLHFGKIKLSMEIFFKQLLT